MKKTVYINLLNFRSNELAGAGVFAKSLLKNWLSSEYNTIDFVILQSATISIKEAFEIEKEWCAKLIKLNFKSLVTRVLFEQLLLPFYLRKATLYFSPTPVLPIVSRVLGGVKLVVTIHDMIPFFIPNKYTRFRSLYVRWISKVGARYAHKVITVSQNSKKDIGTIARVEAEKIEVVYNFFTPAACEKVKNDVTNNLFLSIATVEPGKNVENTLKGFKQFLTTTHLEYKLCWIGGLGWGYNWEGIRVMVNKLELDSNVKFLGFVSEEKKTELLNSCKATVYLSKYEGFGLPLLESMVHGKPILTSNLSSLPEVLGGAGVLCNPSDVVEISNGFKELALHADHYQEPIREQMQKFTEQKQVATFLKVINELFN